MSTIDLEVVHNGEIWVVNLNKQLKYSVYWFKSVNKQRYISSSDVTLLLGYVVLGGLVRYVKKSGKSANNALAAYNQDDVLINGISIKEYCHEKLTRNAPSDEKIRQCGKDIFDWVLRKKLLNHSVQLLHSDSLDHLTDLLEKEVLTVMRLKQSEFRRRLIDRWGGKCVITGIDVEAILRASHIKAYATCNKDEKYDINNGLLLSANLDALFDRHLISFDEKGELIVSKSLTRRQLDFLGLAKPLKIRLDDKQQIYMTEHRKIFYEQELTNF